MLNQLTKPALPIRLLCEELPNVNAFSAHKMFTIFCAPFFNRIPYFKILAMPLVLFIADTNSRKPYVSFRVVWIHTVTMFSFDFLKLSQVLIGYALYSMFFSPTLMSPRKFKVSLLFLKCLV